ncbi:MAG: putative porin [Ferruginibacter sp.]
MKYSVLFFISLFFTGTVKSQEPTAIPLDPSRLGGELRDIKQKKDTGNTGFQQRDDLKDSITISYRLLDALKRYTIDSSINNIDVFFPIPMSYLYMGNNGAAATSLMYKPFAKAGWDAGLHAFDIYKFTLEETKFYKTTRPFSLLGYQLASGQEQMVLAQHTQNIKPNFNAGFDYRLINTPGFFVNQNNNHNSVRFFANYQSKKKRYNNFFVLLSNNIRSAENGGIQNDSSILDPNSKDRFSIDVNLGNQSQYSPNPFSTNIITGNIYRNSGIYLQQSYDLGKKDSVAINDSTTEYLFYPKLRIQHAFTYNNHQYTFRDQIAVPGIYKDWYNISFVGATDTIVAAEKWRFMENDFSLISFPDPKNAAQFIKAGVSLQNINGTTSSGELNFYNVRLHGEYRNRTRNRKWEMLLKGEFYLNGFNTGDYNISASINRFINKKLGDVRLFFNNTNRTPSFIFDSRSSFNLGNNNNSFNKENIISFGATATNPLVNLSFSNHLIANHSYFFNRYQTIQSSKLINILQLSASKKMALSKKWFLYADATLQQTDASAPIRVPLLYTRARLAYEGQLFKNLSLSTGLEVRYFTPYKAYAYSPLVGQFVTQDTFTLRNLPDIHAFLHFRIKSFSGFLRFENLNTISFKNGFGFVNNNFAAPLIPTQGLIFRFGVRWWFVN